MSAPSSDASWIVVAFGTASLDLGALPSHAPIVITHNDELLADESVVLPSEAGAATHLRPGRNLGFGAGVNLAAEHASTERIVLLNPDVTLEPHHATALASGGPGEVVAIPLDGPDATPTVVVAPNFTPARFVASAFRLGARFAPRSSARRRVLSGPGRVRHGWQVSIATHWASGAALSIDRERFLSVGGFDERFFLYYEDADLFRRLAARFPEMVITVADVDPAVHAVGGTAPPTTVRRHRLESALRFAGAQRGLRWRMARAAVGAALLAR